MKPDCLRKASLMGDEAKRSRMLLATLAATLRELSVISYKIVKRKLYALLPIAATLSSIELRTVRTRKIEPGWLRWSRKHEQDAHGHKQGYAALEIARRLGARKVPQGRSATDGPVSQGPRAGCPQKDQPGWLTRPGSERGSGLFYRSFQIFYVPCVPWATHQRPYFFAWHFMPSPPWSEVRSGSWTKKSPPHRGHLPKLDRDLLARLPQRPHHRPETMRVIVGRGRGFRRS
ncbi:hypothetical protein SAMN04487959_12922 [Modicisalibacter xianhensis]|uniref:Uncharacterized protein n=1 Tax=Modicisalibacter xianhensis TaxID=442341 RepID=A0A1I3GBQ2_9GAMM|nr:hypothetical protein SAMN04487959_12922 [Halomonas xianhensis]